MAPRWSASTCTKSDPLTRFSISSAPYGVSTSWAISRVYCGTLVVGDGFVKAAHGVLPVPAPGNAQAAGGISPCGRGPEGAGELVTPTGAALVRVLSSGYTPDEYTPIKSGFGAGTKDPADRPNAFESSSRTTRRADPRRLQWRGNARHARDRRRRHDARARRGRRGCLTRSRRPRCDVHHGR